MDSPRPGQRTIVKVADLIPLQDQRNDEIFRDILERPVRERSKELAKQRDAYCRRLLKAHIPRRLQWLIDRPRLLKRVLRFIPRWQPMLNVVPLGVTTTAEAAVYMSQRWFDAMSEREVEHGGYVFPYTDASGLPAEVYGHAHD